MRRYNPSLRFGQDELRMSGIMMTVALSVAIADAPHSQTLSKEITVDREVVLTHREANRLTTLPKVELPALSKPDLGFAYLTSSAEITDDIELLPPAASADTVAGSRYRGYVMPGYFPLQRINLSAGYRVVDTDRTRVGLWLQYDRNNYESRIESEFDCGARFWKTDLKDNTLAIGAALHHITGRKSWLDASAWYSYARHSFASRDHFGLNRAALAVDYNNAAGDWTYSIGGIGHLYSQAETFSDFKPHEYDFSVRGSFRKSDDRIEKGLQYELNVTHTNLNTYVIHSHVGETAGDHDPSDKNTCGLLSLRPYVRFTGGSLTGSVGVDVEFTANRGPALRVAPAVTLGWRPASGVTLSLDARGGVKRNTYSSLYDASPYIFIEKVYENAYVPVDATLTLLLGKTHGLWASLSGSYSMARDWVMPKEWYEWGTYNISAFRACAAAGYSWRGIIGLKASIETAPHKYNRGYYLWRDRARYVVRASLDLHPLRQLTIDAGWEFRADRCYISYDYDSGLYVRMTPMDNVNNLCAKVSWQFTPAFSVWAEGSNLLNREWQMLNANMSAQLCTALVGFSYLF